MKLFLVRYGNRPAFEVYGNSRAEVEDQHHDTAFLLGLGLSVRPVGDAN